MKKTLAVLAMILMFCVPAIAGDKNLTFEWEHDGIDVAEFHIYKSMAQGVYDHDMDLLVSLPFEGVSATYTSDAVLTSPDGQEVTWYFVCTAVDAEGNESGYSNEISQTIDFAAPNEPYNFSVTIKVTP